MSKCCISYPPENKTIWKGSPNPILRGRKLTTMGFEPLNLTDWDDDSKCPARLEATNSPFGSIRPLRSGIGTTICRSNRPGRVKASPFDGRVGPGRWCWDLFRWKLSKVGIWEKLSWHPRWWLQPTPLKNISQFGSFPQGSGWKKNETTT